MQLLAKNVVKDFAHWRRFFDADRERAASYGLTVNALWQDADDPNVAFFLFDVADRARAEAFMATPESQQAGEDSGVLDGWYHFLESAPR